MFKKAFTLVEIIIVVSIVGMLFMLLSKAYITASELYIYETNHKNIEKDILFLNQTLQNLTDNTEIDYSVYSGFGHDFLNNNKGFTSGLYLKDDEFKYKIYSNNGGIFLDKVSNSSFQIQQIELINTGLDYAKSLTFKIMPYYNPYSSTFVSSAIDIDRVNAMKTQPYVTMFLDIRTKKYNEDKRVNNVKYELQQGFNFRYYNQ